MQITNPTRVFIAAVAAFMLVAAGCGDDSEPDSAASDDDTTETSEPAPDEPEPEESEPAPDEPAPEEEGPALEGELIGLFGTDPTECSVAGSESGTFFRMVAAGGTAEDGPFIANGDSTCADQTFTPLAPGTDGGLLTGELQSGADPLFDADGNATADRITAPTPFFGVAFAMATTDEADPPMITATAGELSGNLAAVSAYYAAETFNQGAPKPDGSTPGVTSPAPIGTIDDDTGEYELAWASQIVGGAFNDFTGVWHLEGTFTPTG